VTYKICTKCKKIIQRYFRRRTKGPYICENCLHPPTPIPKGVATQCVTCRIEFMRKEGDGLQCARCSAMHKHNISKLDKGIYL
jgi:hypothetical protein